MDRGEGYVEAGAPSSWPPTSFLGQLHDDARAALLALGKPIRFWSGQRLLWQGDASRHVILIRAGWTKVTAVTGEGHEALLAIRAAGDIIGELAAIDGSPRSATVTACSPVAASEIARHDIESFLTGHPDAALAVTRTVGDRLRTANRRRLDFSSYGAKVRLARILAEFGRTYGRDTPHGRVILVPLTQPELATAIGAAEVTVHKALRELRAAGLVTTGYRQLTILAPDDLDRLARYN